jgi:hypothetical protein
MAQANYTPVSLYYSTTASAAPTAGNLANGELAINITDGKLYYKDNAGVVQIIATKAAVTNVSSISFGSTGLTPATATTGAVTVAGTLAIANGGTNATATPTAGGVSYGTGSAYAFTAAGTAGYLLTSAGSSAPTWTATTGSGNVVLATSPTLVTPVLGVASATTVNKVTLTAPATGSTLTIADGKTLTASNSITLAGTDSTTMTFPAISSKIGYLNLPAVGTKTSSYTLATADVGKYVQVGTSGAIVIPDATFAEGDIVAIFNNTTGNITITCTITTAYLAGTDADKATVTLATRGVASILFISGTVCVISGNVT